MVTCKIIEFLQWQWWWWWHWYFAGATVCASLWRSSWCKIV